MLFLKNEVSISDNLIDFLQTISLKNLDLTFMSPVKQLSKDNNAFIRFILPGSKLFYEVSEKPFKSHLVFRLI